MLILTASRTYRLQTVAGWIVSIIWPSMLWLLPALFNPEI